MRKLILSLFFVSLFASLSFAKSYKAIITKIDDADARGLVKFYFDAYQNNKVFKSNLTITMEAVPDRVDAKIKDIVDKHKKAKEGKESIQVGHEVNCD